MSAAPYPSSTAHLLAELARAAELVRAEVRRAVQAARSAGKPRCPAIPEDEIEELLRAPVGEEPLPPGEDLAAPALADEIAARALASERAGMSLRLEAVRRNFGLTQLDVDALLVALLPEVDLRYGRLYAYLLKDPSRARPSVHLAISILCPSLEERLAARSRFNPEAPLLRYTLLRAFTPNAQGRPPLLDHALKIDERVIDFLHGSDVIDKRALFEGRLVVPEVRLEDLPLPDDLRRRLLRFVSDAARAPGEGPIIYLQGRRGAGKEAVAEAICGALGIPLLVANTATLFHSADALIAASARWGVDPAPRAPLRLFTREALLFGAALCWDGTDAWFDESKPGSRAALLEAIAEHPGLTFMTGSIAWEPAGALGARRFLRVDMPLLDQPEQERLWKAALARGGADAGGAPAVDPDIDFESLAGMFNLSGGQVRASAAAAHDLARFRDPDGGRITMADLLDAGRRQHSLGGSTLARKIPAQHRWEDLILPGDRVAVLRDIVAHVRYRGRVLGAWGFDRRMSLGKGVSALFAGPPGTGKTMAAGVVAAELGLELYHVDLSGMMSRWIGETEKNIARLFDDAESGNVVLFFDEADALFGKRVQAEDARDRNFNNITGYLLQRVDAFRGVAILASNLPQNMDEAFVRRLRFSLDLPFPSVAERLRIWQRVWPADAPRADDVDLDFLARRLEITGGYIRNIALGAAFQAAAEGRPAGMAHFLRAAKREYVKIGKIVSPELFEYPGAAARGTGRGANGNAPAQGAA